MEAVEYLEGRKYYTVCPPLFRGIRYQSIQACSNLHKKVTISRRFAIGGASKAEKLVWHFIVFSRRLGYGVVSPPPRPRLSRTWVVCFVAANSSPPLPARGSSRLAGGLYPDFSWVGSR